MEKVYEILLKPLVSEKSTALAEVAGRYVFKVLASARKEEIRSAVERLFKVKVTGVRTMMVPGKKKRVGRFEVKRPNWKKAIVSVAEGQRIELFQNK